MVCELQIQKLCMQLFYFYNFHHSIILKSLILKTKVGNKIPNLSTIFKYILYYSVQHYMTLFIYKRSVNERFRQKKIKIKANYCYDTGI